MIAELTEAPERLARDPAVRVVVLTGAGASFCAGGDLDWMRAQMAADAATRAEGATALARMLAALDTLPKPLIGRVQGQAFGGGVGMMSVCDVVVGVDSATFGLTETRLGLIPATIGPYVIARIGAAMARRVFFSGRRFGAGEAVRLGLLARAVPAEELDEAVEAEVAPYLACAPGAVAEGKALVRRLGPRDRRGGDRRDRRGAGAALGVARGGRRDRRLLRPPQAALGRLNRGTAARPPQQSLGARENIGMPLRHLRRGGFAAACDGGFG
jgi:methylglutaconyl-CoA hydratase